MIDFSFPCSKKWHVFDFLQDLKNLRTQLYSAAEYFELSYTNDGDTQSLVKKIIPLNKLLHFFCLFIFLGS